MCLSIMSLVDVISVREYVRDAVCDILVLL